MNLSKCRAIRLPCDCGIKQRATFHTQNLAFPCSSRPHVHNIPSITFSRRRRLPTSITQTSSSSLILRPFLTAAEKTHSTRSFDPFQSPSSAAVFRQEDFELSAEELALKHALKKYQSVVTSMEGANGKDSALTCLHQSALEDLQRAYMDLEYWEEALHIEQDKCRLYLKTNTDEYADSIHAQGKFYLRQENFETSKRLYQDALEYFQASGNSVQQGHVWISLAGWHFFRNQLEEALKCLHQAETLLDSNPSLLVKCLDNQGLIYRLWGDFVTALDKYQQALQVVVDSNIQYALRMHIADMYMALEDSDQAMLAYQELLTDITSTDSNGGTEPPQDQDLSIQGVLLHNIATIHVDQGEYDRALEEFRLSLQIKEKAGGEHNPEMARTWNSLGGLLAGVFDEKLQALDCFQKALMIARIHASGDPQTDPDVLSALQNIATMEHELKNEGRG
ncbi:tetratricopeptide repeat protein [Nitzschia inconspicua]|uniref:Tetratricopeptide repeat protein n=1 Tax=Nitzschia inconspicua TaxID=303405 RepID=A0A9K3KRW5_9STRA|nr:tetratricopeptide repeat protein [Nitzschia inconspicua]